ncbi:hypothetical protein HY345_01965 [Candidatus Microgenomates bacterium]|nr:hypothetical protein [Candidatus Microgenomates bacterium]
MVDWNLVYSFLTALGIFEAIKIILIYFVQNNYLKKNVEIREISDRVLTSLIWLKEKQFTQPLELDIKSKLYLDVHKIQDFDKSLSEDIMMMINVPVVIETLRSNDEKTGYEQNAAVILGYQHTMLDRSEKLVPKLNKLRYQPIIDLSGLIIKIKKWKEKRNK